MSKPKTTANRRILLDRLLAEKGIATNADRRVTRRSGDGPARLSYAQRRLWFLDRIEPGNPYYNVTGSVRLAGPLDAFALERALDEVIRRHESLRTVFVEIDGEPRQLVREPHPIGLALVDLCALAPEARADETRRAGRRDAETGFDLAAGPLVRATLLRESPAEHVLVLTLHHIVSDDWSAGVLVREIAALYEAFAAGRPSPLAPLDLQYADYAEWQRERFAGAELDAQLAYWRERLDGAHMLELPSDRPRPAVNSHRGACEYFAVPEAVTKRVNELARAEGATLFMALLAGFQVALAKYAGRDDVAVGSAIANRNRTEIEPLIGFFVNTLVLRTNLGGDPTFREALARVKATTVDAYAHQELPFERLVEEIAPDRDAAVNPLFQVAFVLQNSPAPARAFGGVTFDVAPNETGTAKFDVALSMEESASGLTGMLEYSTDLFDAATIRRFVGHFVALLDRATASPDARLSGLSMLSDEERRTVVVEWNATAAPVAEPGCVHRLVAARAAETPEALAVASEDASLTYAELVRRARRLANALRASGAGPERLVGLLLPRSIDVAVAALATLEAGAAYVPVDPTTPPERAAALFADARVAVVVTVDALADALPSDLRVLSLDGDAARVAAFPETAPDVDDDPARLAYVIYTSGTTGVPKGVAVTHAGLANLVAWHRAAYAVAPSDRATLVAGLGFDASVWELWPYLAAGASVHLPDEDTRLSAAATLAWLARIEATLAFVPTPLAELAIQEPLPDGLALRAMLTGGDALRRRPSEPLPFALVNHYGPTESAVVATCGEVAPGDDPAPPHIGRPVANVRAYVLDARLAPAPVGVPGELYLAGDGLARGYVDDPALTAERFVPDPFSSEGGRLYRTGDRVRLLATGDVAFIGRADDQVKIRGHRIETGEVEAALNRNPAVRQSAVVVRETSAGDRALVAYVAPSRGAEDAAGAVASVVAEWRELYDDTYSHSAHEEEPEFDVTGWNSSYTGEPIPADEMREWVEATVARIRALGARRVLEIGCGTGLLALRLAPDCDAYVATDFSAATIRRLERVARERGLDSLSLLERAADDFAGIEPGAFDAVVLNSVVQYFPDAAYLARVIEGAAGALAPGGAIVVGDVRSLPLLGAFHASVEAHRAPATAPAAELARAAARGVADESELALDPAFFLAVAARLDRAAHVAASPKRGLATNELTKYRYDVTIRLDASISSAEPDALDWTDDAVSVDGLAYRLKVEHPETLAVRGVPDARVAVDVALARVASGDADLDEIADLVAAARYDADPTAVSPEELTRIAEANGYRVEASCLRGDAAGRFDVVFVREDARADVDFADAATRERAGRTLAALANDPLGGRIAKRLVPELREYLHGRLPDYMIPSAFVVLDDLPLTASGKVDRAALPAPAERRAAADDAPRTETETALGAIWCEVLGAASVGRDENFFEAGGHSLLATQVTSRVRDRFGVELPLRALFEAPTLAGLALRVDAAVASAAPAPPAVPVARRSRASAAPLSLAQRRLWFLDRMEPMNPFYNGDFAVRLRGPLDAAALGRAFDELVRRHESLRTRFVDVDGEPAQLVDAPPSGVLALDDLSALPAADREAEAARLALEEARRPFDLATGPVFRAGLIRLAADDHLLTLTVHHIVSDWWSIGVLTREVSALYTAYVRGEASPLVEPELQFADYAEWQREWLAGDELARQTAYWRERLGGELRPAELATDRPRPRVQTSRGALVTATIPAGSVRRLEALAAAEDATLFMVLAAAFDALVARLSGSEDVVIGTAIANRTRRQFEDLIGFFVNTLVLRTDLSGDPTVREAIGRVKEAALGAYANQDEPFERLVDELAPDRDTSRTPFFQLFFQLRNAPPPVPALDGVEVEPFDVDNGTAIFDLTATLTEERGGIEAAFRYNSDLFDRETVEGLVARYVRVLDEVASDPDVRLSRLSVLDDEERRTVVETWNATDVAREFVAAHDRFLASADAAPAAVAVAHGERQWTYGFLAERARGVAAAVAARGAGHGARVGVLLERGVDLVAAVAGALVAGAAYVPLDPSHPRERLATVLADARPDVVVTTAALAPLVDVDASRVVLVDGPLDGTDAPDVRVAPESPAYVLYTSGSTGTPKGVVMAHGPLANLVAWQTERATPRPARTLQFASITFDVSFQEIFSTLAAGGTLVLVDEDVRRDGERLVRLLDEHAVERVFLPFVALRMLATASAATNVIPRVLAEVVTAGERLEASDDVRRLFERLGGATLRNQYGPTEAHVVSEHVLSGDPSAWADLPPIGRPIDNARLYVLDRSFEPVPPGAVGELYVGGSCLATSYAGRPGQTAERFVPSPFGPEGARLYRTGDLARWRRDGEIEFVGRADDQVKVRGHRVEPAEVEAVVRRAPGVADAAVVAVRPESGSPWLAAYVVARESERVDVDAVRAAVAASLPEYMVPAAIVVLDALPVTTSGKLDRRALPSPERAAASERGYVAPRTPTEELLAGIWRDALGAGRVGAFDDFFDAGGHSLVATHVASRVRRAFGVDLPLRAIFEERTLERLARRIDDALRAGTGAPATPVRPVDRSVPLPLSFAQRRLWFLNRLEPHSPAYAMPGAVALDGPLDRDALDRALVEVARRHEALRTTIVEVDGEPRQLVGPAGTSPLRALDADRLDDDAVLALLRREAARPFDLATEPPYRAVLVRRGEDAHVLVVTLHHVAADGRAVSVLFGEIAALYAAFAAGAPSSLAEPPVQYGDYAAWQRERLSGDELDRQLAYWTDRLADAPALELPIDRPRTAERTGEAATLALDLPAELVSRLEALAAREGATLFMVLVALYDALLARFCGADDVVVGTPVANRATPEVEDLVGLFVNTLALRTDVSGDPTFSELILRVRETALGAFARQETPFEAVVERLDPERDLGRSPIFQVAIALVDAPSLDAEVAGLRMSPVDLGAFGAKFDLTLSAERSPRGLSAALEYATDLFDAATVERLARHFLALAEAAAEDASRRLSDVPALDADEARRTLVEWNAAGAVDAEPVALHRAFESLARTAPHADALVFGDATLDYGALDAAANRLARRLRVLGAAPETRVAICLERTADLVVAILASLKTGAAYVPLDPAYPAGRVAATLVDARPSVVVTRANLLDGVALGAARVLDLDAEHGTILAESAEPLDVRVDPSSLAYVLFTSGSTGEPKGVAIEHRSAAALVAWSRAAYSDDDVARVLFSTSVCFDLSVFELFVPLSRGGAVVVAENALHLPSLSAASDVTLVNTVPSVAAELVRLGWRGPALRVVNLAGEPLRGALARDVYRTLGARRVVNLYGPTEDTTYSTAAEVARDGASEPTIGRPVAGARVYLLGRDLRPVPVGATGEIYLAGDGTARGYLGRPDLTADRFVPEPVSGEPGARMYRTGDLGRYCADGSLVFLGRADHQVKLRGFRIELGDVEAALLAADGVREAVAVVREDASGELALVGYVACEAGAGVEAEIARVAAARVPAYMAPSRVVRLDALPRTPNGKVDRRALPAPPATDAPRRAPETATERLVADVWRDVLGLAEVGADERFFDVGGHSLKAARVAARLRDALGREVPLRLLFEAHTVEEIAARLDALAVAPRRPRIRPAAAGAHAPLSFAQQRLWFLDRLEPGNVAYNVPGAVRLAGRLDAAALERAFRAVVARHDALRTRFVTVDGVGFQEIADENGATFATADVSHLDPASREDEALRLAARDAVRPFDLEAGGLVRALLVRLSDEDHLLAITAHHIVSDGWSVGVLVRDLTALYAAEVEGRDARLPELPIRYADYAVWQRAWLTGAPLDEQIAYWRERLAGVEPLDLPADRPRPAAQSGRGGRVAFELSEAATHALGELGRREDATPFVTLLAGFAALLHRYTGAADVAIGTDVANRSTVETEGLVGFFANQLVVRANVSGRPTFRDLLARVRESAIGALAHQDVPFEKLVEELAPARDLGRTPFFQAKLVWQEAPPEPADAPGLRVSPASLEAATAKFDLTLFAHEANGRVSGALEYNADLFDADRIERLAGHLATLLAAAAADPDARVAALPLFDADELARVTVACNDTAAEYPREATIHALFERAVDATPDAVAVRADGATASYRELDARANRLANHLRAVGVGPEVRVGVLLERGLDAVVAILGVLKAGGAYVPINAADPAERVAAVLDDSAVPVLVTAERFVDELPSFWGLVVSVDGDAAGIAAASDARPEVASDPRDLAYVIYTSGSTGRPKGVAIEHRGVVNYLTWAADIYGVADGGAPLHSPLAFDLTVTTLFAPLVRGAAIDVVSTGEGVAPLAEALASCRYALAKLTPSHLDAIAAGAPNAVASGASVLVLGGEALAAESLRWWRARAPGLRVVNEYGPTETVVGCSYYEVPAGDPGSGPVPIGAPIANARLYVLDADLRPAPVGVPGELYVGGDCVGRGYLNRPALTAAAWIPDPFAAESGARLYRTGDLVRRRAGGTLEYLGRRDEQVKVRGYRVELGEVESALASHPAVREAVVVARDAGAGGRALVAYVVETREVEPAALREHMHRLVPEYMVPSAFVALDAIPVTANGKIDRRALPAHGAATATREHVAPRTETESALAAIWTSVLGVERVGATDNFFDLGGHSLIAAHLVHRVATELGAAVTLRDLFLAPTVAELAAHVEASQTVASVEDEAPTLVHDASARFEPFPLTEVQQAYWIGRGGGFDLGNVSAHGYVELEGSGLDLDRLAVALRRTIARHDALRTVVTSDGEQRVLASVPDFELTVADLRELSAADAERALVDAREATSHEVRPADRWPLFDVRVSLLADGRQRFALSVDALVCDAWSLRLLAADVARFYADPEAPLDAPEITFRDYVVAVESAKGTPAFARAADYWRERAAELPHAPDLPLAADPATIASPRFARRAATLDREAWSRLQERAARAGVTPSGALVAAYASALAAWSKSPSLTVNLTLFNRLPLHERVRDLVGDFTSVTLLGVDAAPGEPFEARARRTQERLWSDLDHRRFGGVSVLRELARRGSAAAAMPVVFTSVLVPDAEAAAEARERTPLDDFDLVYAVTQTPQVWIDCQAVERDGELLLAWDAIEELFPEAMLDDMFGAFEGLVRALADDEAAWTAPSRRLVPERQLAERARANATAAPLPGGTLHGRVEAAARRFAGRPAVIAPDRTLDYAELDALANAVADAIGDASPNTLVALVMRKGWEQIVGALGALKSGAAYVPIDADLPAERVAHLLAHSGATVALTQSDLDREIAWPEGVRPVVVSDDGLAGRSREPRPARATESDLAYVIYTSGSTGLPKGVMIDHRGAVNTVVDVNERFGVGPDDRVLGLSSMSFDLSVYDAFGPLAVGGALVLPEADAARDPSRWAELVAAHGVTIWNSVPALMEMFVDYAEGRGASSGLRLALLSGDWIPLALPDRVRAVAPGARVVGLGGATEASIWSILHEIAEVDPSWPSVPYGSPMSNQSFHVLDDAFEPCPVWAPGQLYIGGSGVALGYWRDAERTAASFVRHPRTGERLYRTGDLGRYLPGGEIQFLGREDFQVKIQGYRVELGEIEAALSRHEDVRAAAVVATGEARGVKRLVAYVAGPESLDASALAAHAAALLPRYMVPSTFVVARALPLTANGKVDRGALSGLAAADEPATPVADATVSPSAGRVAAIVASALGLAAVDATANLLDLGASSLDVVRVVNRLDRELGFRPRVDELYRTPTVAWIAAAYDGAAPEAADAPTDGASAAPAPRRDLDAIGDAIDRIKGLSREELAAALAARRAARAAKGDA